MTAMQTEILSILLTDAQNVERSFNVRTWILSIAHTAVSGWRTQMIKYFIIGLLIGAVIGYTVAALMVVAEGEDET